MVSLIFLNPSAAVTICNQQSTEVYHEKTPLQFYYSIASISHHSNNFQKLPYDKADMSVKRIDAFRIEDPGRRAVYSNLSSILRHCPKSSPARLQRLRRRQAEIIQEGPATIPEQYATGQDPGYADRKYWYTNRACLLGLRPVCGRW